MLMTSLVERSQRKEETMNRDKEFAQVLDRIKEEYSYLTKMPVAPDPIGSAIYTVWAEREYEKEQSVREKRKCKTCKWWFFEDISNRRICINDESDECGEMVDESDGCEMWEKRDE